MEKAGTKTDFVKDKVIIFGKEISLQFTLSGHYTIPLNDYHEDLKLSIDQSKFTKVLLNIVNIEKKSKKRKQKIAMKFTCSLNILKIQD